MSPHSWEVNELRHAVVGEVFELMARRNRAPGTAQDTTSFDAAVCELADKLREPETCPSCGQPVKPGEEHP